MGDRGEDPVFHGWAGKGCLEEVAPTPGVEDKELPRNEAARREEEGQGPRDDRAQRVLRM